MAKARNVAETSTRSEEYVVESSSEGEAETGLNSGTSKLNVSTSSSGASSSKSDSEAESSTESDSAASSSDSDIRETSVTKKRAKSTKSAREQSSKKSKLGSTESSTRTRRFDPPPGYKSLQPDASDFVSDSGNMFTNLNGKQVWHITAPASIPIASIKALDIPAALRGDPIFNHDGISYNMFVGPSKGEALLMPDGADSKYSKANIEVSRSFHLREIQKSNAEKAHASSLDDGTDDHPAGNEISFVAHQQGARKPPRKQPKGLLMRYQPYGTALSNKPYKLADPATEEMEVEANSQDTLIVPASLSDEELVDRTRTPKKKKSKRPKTDLSMSEINPSKEDAMEIDTEDNATLETPQSKVVKSASKPESEKKRKKDRKEKA